MFTSQLLRPWKFTWNLKITQLKRTIIFQTSIFGFHVNFPVFLRNFHLSTFPCFTSALLRKRCLLYLPQESNSHAKKKHRHPNSHTISHRIHVLYIYLLIYHKKSAIHVGTVNRAMDPMGYCFDFLFVKRFDGRFGHPHWYRISSINRMEWYW